MITGRCPFSRPPPAQTGERLTDRRFGCSEGHEPPNPPFPALSFSAQAAADMLDLIVIQLRAIRRYLTKFEMERFNACFSQVP